MKEIIFFDCNGIKIINDDVLTTNEIDKNSIDLIVTSSPYNVDINYISHNDKLSYFKYLDFSKKWLSNC